LLLLKITLPPVLKAGLIGAYNSLNVFIKNIYIYS